MLAALKQQFRTWLFRPKIESGTVTLNQRRIFILPTKQGWGFAGMLLLMLLGDINYNLGLGYVLTFLLATAGAMTMLHAFRNMAQLEVRAGRTDAVFAGDVAQFVFHFHNNGRLPRYHLSLRDSSGNNSIFDLPAQHSTEVRLAIPAVRRGWLGTGRLTLFTEFPLGLFHAWSYLEFDTRCLVYPRPSAPLPLPASPSQNGTGALSTAGDEDFAGLRSYAAGDALQRIAWKALAREQGLQVKQFSAQQGRELWLDWKLLPALDSERKLEVLARWVLDADARSIHYGLRLPNIELLPEHGAQHRAECLRALALFGLNDELHPLPQPLPPRGRGAKEAPPPRGEGLGERGFDGHKKMKLSTPIIFGLLASILLVSAPHAEHLPLWVSALAAMLLGWRAYLVYSGNPLPARGLLITITLGSVGAIFTSFHTLFGREAGVTLLILLATLKLLEVRTLRDAIVLLNLACFIIITNFFYSQSIPTALFMLATLLVILATWIHLQTGTLPFKPRLRIASVLLLQAIPLTLILFVLFPRVQGPLWGLPQDAYASSGLDDRMSPGSLSKLSLSDAVAFRVTFTDKPPNREQMYWRGPVLWEFDGRTWTPGKPLRSGPPRLDNLSSPIDYTVTLEPHNKTWLFMLEMPTQISVPAGLTYDFQVQGNSNVTARLRYTAHSQLGYRANAEESPLQLQRALAIPHDLNPRAQQLAAGWRENLHSDEEMMQAALGYFNREGFQYTLEPPPLGMHTVDDFLFGTHRGFCEHYASSFVFLMRAAGVPARVVTGYQGGAYNGLGNYYIVRQSDAHAWAEVWLRGRGWVRVDPTAAIAPARVQSGLAAAVPASDSAVLPFLARTQSAWLLNLRLNLDLLANQWNQWVLGYNPERQFAFLTRMGMEEITWQKMAFTMMGGMGVLVGLFALLMLRRLRAQHADKAQTAWLKLCKKLARSGLPRATHEGPEDYSRRVTKARPHLADALHELSRSYIALRYGKQHNGQALREFQHRVNAFKP